MAKFRKKPKVVKGFHLTMETRWDNSNWPDWMHAAWNTDGEGGIWPDSDDADNCFQKSVDDLRIGTKEGVMRCPIGWWIIKGVEGEIYACAPSIFEKTYERVEI